MVLVVVDFLFIVTPIVGVCNCSMFCCTLLYVNSSIAIILMGKRELVALPYLSSWCLVMVEWLFLAVQWGCLRFAIVVFPDHIHLLFFTVMSIQLAFKISEPNGKIFRRTHVVSIDLCTHFNTSCLVEIPHCSATGNIRARLLNRINRPHSHAQNLHM